MDRVARVTRSGFPSGMITLGVIGFALRDFLVWGTLPAWVPWHTTLALICAALALVAGGALVFERTPAAASGVVLVYVAVWWSRDAA